MMRAKVLPDASHPEPPKSLSNRSPLPALRLVILDRCGNRVSYPPLLRGLEVALTFGEEGSRSPAGGSAAAAAGAAAAVATSLAVVRPVASLAPADAPVGAQPFEGSGSRPKSQGWGDLGTVAVSTGWGVLVAAKAPVGAWVEARLSGPLAAPACFGELGGTKEAPHHAVMWRHNVTVTASSEPAAIGLGRPNGQTRGEAAAEIPHGGVNGGGSSSTVEIDWLPQPLGSGLGSGGGVVEGTAEGTEEVPGYLTRPAALNGEVPRLAAFAGGGVSRWVARVVDEAGRPWSPPSSGWRVAICTTAGGGRLRGGGRGGRGGFPAGGGGGGGGGEGRLVVVAVVALPSKEPVECLRLPDWKLPTRAGIERLSVRLLRPSGLGPGDCQGENDDGDEEEVDKETALEFAASLELLPAAPHKLRLSPIEGTEQGVTHSKGGRGGAGGGGGGRPGPPVLPCGQELVLAVHVEDEHRNPIIRVLWPALWAAQRGGPRPSDAASNVDGPTGGAAGVLHTDALGWLLPVNSEEHAVDPVDLLAVAPALFLKAPDDGSSVGGGGSAAVSHEVRPRRVVETAFGWELEGVAVGGRADGREHKIIVRDPTGRLGPSNVHVAFEAGPADRVELNGTLAWLAPGSTWVPPSPIPAPESAQAGSPAQAGTAAALKRGSSPALTARNGSRMPTLSVAAFDRWDNPVGGKKRPRPTVSLYVRLAPAPGPPSPVAAGTAAAAASGPRRRRNHQETHAPEEVFELSLREADADTNSAVSREDGSVSASFGREGSASFQDVVVSRRGGHGPVPPGGLACELLVALADLPSRPGFGAGADESSLLELRVGLRLQPGRHPQCIDVLVAEPLPGDEAGAGGAGGSPWPSQGPPANFRWHPLPLAPVSCPMAPSLPLVPTATLQVIAGCPLPPLRLVLRSEDGTDLTSGRRAAELRVDIFAPVQKSSGSPVSSAPSRPRPRALLCCPARLVHFSF